MKLRGKSTSSRLRQRLTLQQETRTDDSAGGYERGWEDVAELWAEIIPLNGREQVFAGQIHGELTHRILLRYRAGVTPGQRLVFESRAFNIRAVMNRNEDKETLEILAEEGVAS